jgi:hypothetical protein
MTGAERLELRRLIDASVRARLRAERREALGRCQHCRCSWLAVTPGCPACDEYRALRPERLEELREIWRARGCCSGSAAHWTYGRPDAIAAIGGMRAGPAGNPYAPGASTGRVGRCGLEELAPRARARPTAQRPPEPLVRRFRTSRGRLRASPLRYQRRLRLGWRRLWLLLRGRRRSSSPARPALLGHPCKRLLAEPLRVVRAALGLLAPGGSCLAASSSLGGLASSLLLAPSSKGIGRLLHAGKA